MKTRVGIVSHDFFPVRGGQGTYLQEILPWIKKSKTYEPFLIVPNPNNEKSFAIKGSNSLLFSLKFNIKLSRIVKEYKIDILHIQGGPGGVFLFRKPEVPVVYTVHHSYLKKSQQLKSILSKILFYLERRGYKLSSKLIVPATSLKDYLVENYQISRKKIVYIPEGINPSIFYNLHKNGKESNSLLYVGRLSPIKGILSLIDSISICKRNFPDIKLYIIGKGEMKREIEKKIVTGGLEDSIKLLGGLSQDKINDWYNKVRVTVLPSFFEGFGLTALESAAAGTPVIITKDSGVSEIIKKEKYGEVVQSNNPKILAKTIVSVLTNQQRNLRRISPKYYWKEIAKKTIEVYNGF